MSRFSPYQVIHIRLNQWEDWPKCTTPALYFFWWHQRPIAHFWAEKNSTQANFQTEVLAACSKAQGWNIEGISNWEELIAAIQSLPPLMGEGQTQNLSIVVCTRNRRDDLKKCLDQLLLSIQDTDEIIVVDNAPDNNSTASLVAQYNNIKYVLETRKGLDIARNTGAKAASNQIITYTDDDVQVATDWVDTIRNAFDDPMTMAITGLVIPQSLETLTQYIFERYWDLIGATKKRHLTKLILK